VACSSTVGLRSSIYAQELISQGISAANLQGGILAWVRFQWQWQWPRRKVPAAGFPFQWLHQVVSPVAQPLLCMTSSQHDSWTATAVHHFRAPHTAVTAAVAAAWSLSDVELLLYFMLLITSPMTCTHISPIHRFYCPPK
jgi:hypothetical protein